MPLRNVFISAFLLFSAVSKAQEIDNIYVNLYTDSLKKGRYNYINIDGRLSNGNYIPLDSTSVTFWASDGKFYGNTLLLDQDFKKDRVLIKVSLKNNPAIAREFTMFIKKNPEDETLKTADEIMRDMQNSPPAKSKKRS